jgi:hypothetical protein
MEGDQFVVARGAMSISLTMAAMYSPLLYRQEPPISEK